MLKFHILRWYNHITLLLPLLLMDCIQKQSSFAVCTSRTCRLIEKQRAPNRSDLTIFLLPINGKWFLLWMIAPQEPGFFFNRVTQTNDLQLRPKLTLIVSLKHYFWQDSIHHVTKWLVYFCSYGLHQQILAIVYYTKKIVMMIMKDLNNSHWLWPRLGLEILSYRQEKN